MIISRALWCLILFGAIACKPTHRHASFPNELIFENASAGLQTEERNLLPVMYCADKGFNESFNGQISSAPHNEFRFNTQYITPLSRNAECFMHLYTTNVEGLKLLDPHQRVINGDEYKVVYTSSRRTLEKLGGAFSFKRLYSIISEEIVGKITLVFEEKVNAEHFRLYCGNTKVIPFLRATDNSIMSNLKNTDIEGEGLTLLECQVKDITSETVVKAEIPSSIELSTNPTYFIKKQPPTSDEISLKTSAIYNFLNSKVFYFDSSNCRHRLEFKLEDGKNLYRSFLVDKEGCDQIPYDTAFLEYNIFLQNDILGSLVNENSPLIQFHKADKSITYSILKIQTNGFEKIGGHISKVELLKKVDSGIDFTIEE